MYCCCLVTKSCSNLATPWKVAHQTSLTICVCIYIYIYIYIYFQLIYLNYINHKPETQTQM